MQKTRRRILELLKNQGPQTAGELSSQLEISTMGARQHLNALERDRLVEYRTECRGLGRSSHVYSLTSEGDEVFPRAYQDLANDLIETVRAMDADPGVNRIFERRVQRLSAQYLAHIGYRQLGDQLDRLAKIRTNEGFMAHSEKVGENAYLLVENNCPIYQVASNCSEACGSELELFRRVLKGAKVARRQHIMSGDKCCSYLVEPPDFGDEAG